MGDNLDINMQDFLDSFWEWYKEKTTSPLFATFVFCFVIENWKIFFTLFFQDSVIIGIPKIEYINKYFFGDQGWLLVFDYLKVFLIPIIFTYLIIRWLPYISAWAHKLSVLHYFERKGFYDRALLDFEKAKNVDLNMLADVKVEQANAIERIEQSTPEAWERDFKVLEDRLNEVGFSNAIKQIYGEGGFVSRMPSSFVAFGDVNGLLEFNDNRSAVSLTDKGKFFAKKIL